jgi:DNA repair exonuclease SbcCD ATPase subunit
MAKITIDTIVERTLENEIIDYIIHISDIHLKSDKKMEKQYEDINEKLKEYIKTIKSKSKNKIAVIITGDVIDTRVNEHTNIFVKKFYTAITNEADYTITILGNHDYDNLSDVIDGYDKLSSIIEYGFSTKNKSYLLKENGIYHFKNIVLGYTDCNTIKITPCNTKGKLKIGLYHGYLKGSFAEHNRTNSGYFNVNDFTKIYDYTLLGDIHSRNYINKKKNIWYAGSLFQHKIDEDIVKGGVLLDIANRKSEFFNIESIYGMVEIDIDDDYDNLDIIIPANSKVKLNCKTLDNNKINKVIDQLKKRSNIEDLQMYYTNEKKITTEITIDNEKYNLFDIKDRNTLVTIFEKFIRSKKLIEDENKIDRIKSKLLNVLTNIDNKILESNKKKRIGLKIMRFSNIFCYGKDNILDFTKFSQAMAISQDNDYGKTSLIDTINIAIFGESFKTSKYWDYINYNENEAKTSIIVIVDNDEYMIERTFTKIYEKNKDYGKVQHVARVYKNNKKICDSVKEVDKFLVNNIGTFSDYLSTTIINHNKKEAFINTDKKLSFIAKYAGIPHIDNLVVSIKKEKKNILGLLTKSIKNKENDPLYKEYIINVKARKELKPNRKNIIINLEKEIDNKNKEIEEINNKINEYGQKNNDQITMIANYKHEIKYDNKLLDKYKVYNLEKIENEIIDLEESVIVNQKEQKELEKKLKKLNKEKIKLEKKINEKKHLDKAKEDLDKNIEINIGKLREKINKNVKLLKNDNNCKLDHDKLAEEIEKINKLLIEMNDEKKELENKINLYSIDGIKRCFGDYLEAHKYDLFNQIKNLVSKKNVKKIIDELEIDDTKDYNKIRDDYKNLLETDDFNKAYFESLNKMKQMNEKITELKRKKEIYENKQNNLGIEEKIKRLEEDITTEQNRTVKGYERYINNKERLMIVENEIKTIEKDIEIKRLEIDKQDKDKNEKETIKNEIENNKELIEKINKNERMIEEYEKEMNRNNERIEEEKRIKIKREMELINLNTKKNSANDYIEEYERNIADIDDYKILKDMFNINSELPKLIYSGILNKLEERTNNILDIINYPRIKIINNNDDDIKLMRIDNNSPLNLSGNHRSLIYEIVLRLALFNINNSDNNSFVIIDELLDGCSESNKYVIFKFIEYLKTQYEWILVITHDTEIKKYIDNMITIYQDKRANAVYSKLI